MQGSAAMKCNEGNLRSAFQGVAFGRALATFVRQRAQLLFHGLAVCDSTSHGRTNGDSRWPWKEQPRPGGHAGSRMAPGSLLSMSALAPIRARGAHALASAQLLFRGLAVSDSTSHGGTMGDSRGRGRSSGAPEGTRHALTGIV